MDISIPKINIRIPQLGDKAKKGHVVHLDGEEHDYATFTRQNNNIDLAIPETLDRAGLKKLGSSGKPLTLCFSPRLIYADTGEFTNVSPEATHAHIYTTVEKLRLFNDDYAIAYTRINDIDATRSTFSYVAVPKSEADVSEFIDEDNTWVDVLCPIEAALTAALALVDKEMAIVLLEDVRNVRIVGAKNGVVYYLITINISDSFDPEADTVAGINEMKALLMNAYREKASNIYLVGVETLSEEGFEKHGIEVQPFPIFYGDDLAMTHPVLIGAAMQRRYNFISNRLQSTKKIMNLSMISMGVSACMLLIAVIFAGMGIFNMFTSKEYDERIMIAENRKAAELVQIEKDYQEVSERLDLSNVNTLVQNYKEFQAEPKLPSIINTVSQKIPASVFLTRIEVQRPDKGEGGPPMRVGTVPGEEIDHAREINHFKINVEGVINVPYPQSRTVFSRLLMSLKEVYCIQSANFYHRQDSASFVLKCRVKI